MSLWNRIKTRLTGERALQVSPALAAALDAWFEGGVTGAEAFKCTSVLAASRILSETVAQIPLKVFERNPNDPDDRTEAREHPLYSLLGTSPNRDMTSFEWRERMMLDCCVYGDSFSQVVMNGKKEVIELIPLESKRVTVERDSAGDIVYRYERENSGGTREFSAGEVLQVPLMLNGLRGRSLVDMAARAVGLAINAQEFAARFFENDTSVRLVYKLPEKVGVEKAAEITKFLQENYSGVKRAHKQLVLPGGTDVTTLQDDVEKLQLIETRKFQVEEVGRVFRVPLHLLQSLDRATFNNIEHLGIEYVVYSISPWLRRIEQRLMKTLLGPRESQRFYIEFDVDGLLRGDYKSRVEGMSREITSGLMTPNEGRRKLNRAPKDAGDKLFMQSAMAPIESLPLQKGGAAGSNENEDKQEAA